jgi:hypothetical protein
MSSSGKLELYLHSPMCLHGVMLDSLSTGIALFYFYFSFFFSSEGGVRLSPLGTSATNWPIVPAPDDRWWVWSNWWTENWQGKPKYSEKTYPSATSPTTDLTWPDLGSNLGRRGGKPATNSLSYGTALPFTLLINSMQQNHFWEADISSASQEAHL